jgi:energy-coupling factor transporter transmembrane protein EcfT
MRISQLHFHFLTIFIMGCSATFWAVYETKLLMPVFWLIFLSSWIIIIAPAEFKMFFRRLSQIGLLLLIVSFLQIIFRRQGDVVFSIKGFPVVFSTGLREAILLWIRYMIIFMLAYIFARVSLFEFLLFLNKIKISLQFSLLLLTTLKFIPFIFNEAKKGLWAIRFRGIDIRKLSIKGKYLTFKKLLMPLLFRGIHYASFSSLALELRGYGAVDHIKISQAYPLKTNDYCVLIFVLIVNLAGIFFK